MNIVEKARQLRALLKAFAADSGDKTLAIACSAYFAPWTPGVYVAGDIRTDPQTGYPKQCITAHDSTVNRDWTITTPSLWKPFHSRKQEYALPWEAPTGAHDRYLAGEYMVWTDGGIYRCLADTGFSPDIQADAWHREGSL